MLQGFFDKNLQDVLLGERHADSLFISNMIAAAGATDQPLDPNQIAI
jgi:hypothetical protein